MNTHAEVHCHAGGCKHAPRSRLVCEGITSRQVNAVITENSMTASLQLHRTCPHRGVPGKRPRLRCGPASTTPSDPGALDMTTRPSTPAALASRALLQGELPPPHIWRPVRHRATLRAPHTRKRPHTHSRTSPNTSRSPSPGLPPHPPLGGLQCFRSGSHAACCALRHALCSTPRHDCAGPAWAVGQQCVWPEEEKMRRERGGVAGGFCAGGESPCWGALRGREVTRRRRPRGPASRR